jgi:CcmD family protein
VPVVDYLAQHSLYTVLVVVLAVWLGILAYLFRIERRIRKLELETPQPKQEQERAGA